MLERDHHCRVKPIRQTIEANAASSRYSSISFVDRAPPVDGGVA
jgi:hypothetical protein